MELPIFQATAGRESECDPGGRDLTAMPGRPRTLTTAPGITVDADLGFGGVQDGAASIDGRSLLRGLAREATCYPKATVLVEFATFGPVLNTLVGGRRGVPRHRRGIQRDEERFIPLYRQTLAALLSDVPQGSRLIPVVDWVIEQDHRENANLLLAFDLLDPPGDDVPRVVAATRYAAPAAAHAAAKFALLAPVFFPAVGAAAVGWARSLWTCDD